MSITCGIVGLPNVGKSTLFNALTNAKIAAENFPFCTIEPNTGIVRVPDSRLDRLSEIVKPERVVPTTIEFTDIAGLVEGASKGQGKGNQFLSHIREVDAIVHVVRCFADDNVVHVANRVDPRDDAAIINMELVLADMEIVERARAKVQRQAASGDKQAKVLFDVLEQAFVCLDAGRPLRSLNQLAPEEKLLLKGYNLITIKPMLYLANVSEDGFAGNDYLDQLVGLAKEEGAELVSMCNRYEAEMVDMSNDEKHEFLSAIGQSETGLDKFIRASYQLLNIHTYFTAGVKEVRAWTIKKNASAPEAAGVIHSDFERGFIRAEVISFDDFLQYKGEQGAKDAGKLTSEGKTYIVKDGDIIHFRFNV